MSRHPAFSLADFAAAGVRLRPTDAVTIVRAVVAQVAEGSLPGVPSAHVIRLLPSGAVTIEGPVVASGRPLPRAAQLLGALLRGSQRNASEPTRLRRVIAQALLDPPGFATLNDFAAALAPFGAQDSAAAIRELTARLSDAAQAVAVEQPVPEGDAADVGEMTVSDIRRARRDTGLSLSEISKRSRIPVSMLRQLEWGYLRNWPAGLYGRTQLARYARAAGLNKQVVLDAIRPLIAPSGEPHDSPVVHPRAIGDSGDRPVASGIQIVQPTFAADEVLFEAEHGPDVRSPGTAVPMVQHPRAVPSAAIVVAAVPQAAVAEQAQADPAAHVLLDTGVSGPATAPATGPVPEPAAQTDSLLYAGSMEPADANDAPRRSSKVAAAAVLVLAAAGAFWGIQAGDGTNERISSRVVRRVPMRDQPVGAAPAAEENSRLRRQPAVPLLPAPGARDRRQPVPEQVVHAAPALPLRPLEVADDEGVEARPSAGGVAFADPVLLPTGAGAPSDGGLGLRITRVLDDQGRNEHARPSPDGTRVAFDSDRDGQRAVFVADANGQNLRRVSGAGAAAAPNWSPDGRALSYVRAEEHNPSVWNLWALDLATGESRRLTSHTSGRPVGGAWFPDGKRLAYSRGTDVVVLDVPSGRSAVYPAPQAGRRVGAPAVSPDGRWIVYHVEKDGAWLMDLGDGSSRKVLSDPSIGDLAWSPDGSRVAFYSRREREWGVWMMAAR
jgi:hypothetical protein